MTFTFDSALATLLSQVRLELGDTVSGAGVGPDGANLDDASITLWLTQENSNVMRAVARACLALSRYWSNIASTSSPDYSEQSGKIAKEWSDRADAIMKMYGSISSVGGLRVSQMGRNDGYSINNSRSGTEYTGSGPIFIVP